MHKILFMGTPSIAAAVLESLLIPNKNWEVVGVVCQPDRAKDRKGNPIFCPTKKIALEHQIPVYQADKVNEITNELIALNYDLIVTCAFGQFVGKKLIQAAKYGGVNLHASLLPKLRGGAPIHWAIMNGDTETGISLMKLAPKMDSGDFLVQRKCEITKSETMDSLLEKLTKIGQEMITKDLPRVFDLSEVWTAQDENEVTFGYNVSKENAKLNFQVFFTRFIPWKSPPQFQAFLDSLWLLTSLCIDRNKAHRTLWVAPVR